jgi:ArsR family transcriptional regulator
MNLAQCVETLHLLGDESRIRLCALLRDRELCVSDLVRITGISQSRVSTHLGRLREAGYVRDRRQGPQTFYALSHEQLPKTAQAVLEEAAQSGDATLTGDLQRLAELEAERRGQQTSSLADELESYYSPGRTWQSLTVGLAALLQLGDVLDVGSGEGAAAAVLAPYCRSLTCLDLSPRLVSAAQTRLHKRKHVRVLRADAHALPFAAASFDAALLFHTLTYAERPLEVVRECARVLRPAGRLVVLCLDQHEQTTLTAPYGERHAGFSPAALTELLKTAGLRVSFAEVACRETRKPRLQVVLAVGDKPAVRAQPKTTESDS